MKEPSTEIIAACRLICDDCDIYKATDNTEIAAGISNWFKKNQGIENNAEDVQCGSCRVKGEEHWSADCWILKCCVDEKNLEYCYQCPEFPCDRLKDWSKESGSYAKALNRLNNMC